MRNRWMAMLLVLALLAAAFAAAEEEAPPVLPLQDAAVTAALAVGQDLTPDGLTTEFAQALLQALVQQGQLDKDVLSGPEKQTRALSALVSGTLPEMKGKLRAEALPRCGLQVMSSDVDEDGGAQMVIGTVYHVDDQGGMIYRDQRAVLELHRSEESPFGWKLHSLSLDGELVMEEITQAYFARMMVEYVDAEQGFSILYPAVFPEENVLECEGGVSAVTPDGSVSFMAVREDLEKTVTPEAFLAEKKKEIPALETNIDEMTGCIRTRCITEEGQVQADFYHLTGDSVYHAQLTYPAGQEESYALYLEYMMNSFTVDELSLG